MVIFRQKQFDATADDSFQSNADKAFDELIKILKMRDSSPGSIPHWMRVYGSALEKASGFACEISCFKKNPGASIFYGLGDLRLKSKLNSYLSPGTPKDPLEYVKWRWKLVASQSNLGKVKYTGKIAPNMTQEDIEQIYPLLIYLAYLFTGQLTKESDWWDIYNVSPLNFSHPGPFGNSIVNFDRGRELTATILKKVLISYNSEDSKEVIQILDRIIRNIN